MQSEFFTKSKLCAFCSYTSRLAPPTDDGKATKHKLRFLPDDGMIGDFYFLVYAFLHLNIFLKWAWTQVTFSCKEQKTLPQAGLHNADIDKCMVMGNLAGREPQARGTFTSDLLCPLHLSSLWPAPQPTSASSKAASPCGHSSAVTVPRIRVDAAVSRHRNGPILFQCLLFRMQKPFPKPPSDFLGGSSVRTGLQAHS